MAEDNEKKIVSFEEDEDILKLADEAAKNVGMSRSAFFRRAIREKLARMSYLSPEVKKALEIEAETMT